MIPGEGLWLCSEKCLSTLGSSGSQLKAGRVWCLGVGLLPCTALGPSAQRGAGGLGGFGTEEVSGALDLSFVQGPSPCGGSVALRLRGACCFCAAACCL